MKVYLDFWNFTMNLNEKTKIKKLGDYKYKIQKQKNLNQDHY